MGRGVSTRGAEVEAEAKGTGEGGAEDKYISQSVGQIK